MPNEDLILHENTIPADYTVKKGMLFHGLKDILSDFEL